MASIVVTGCVLRRPQGGDLAAHLHYLIGLRKLGHQVAYLEERGLPGGDPGQAGGSGVPRAGLMLLRDLLRRCRVEVPVVWVDADAGLVGGMVWPQLRRRLARADLLLDLGGHCWLEERSLVGRRALVDVDGVAGAGSAGRQDDHDFLFTYAREPGALRDAGWLPTLPPVVPRLWYGPRVHERMPVQALLDGPSLSGAELRAAQDLLLELPARARPPLQIALPEGCDELARRVQRAGWRLEAGAGPQRSLSAFRGHVVGARAAISLLEGTAGATGCWLSTRSACFLAAGRPVLVPGAQPGGPLPGGGLLGFEGVEGAVEALDRIDADLEGHARQARMLAEQLLHFRVVLPALIERALSGRLHLAA